MQKENNQKKIFRTKDIISLIFFTISLSVSIYQIIIVHYLPLGEGRVVNYLILILSLPATIFLVIGLLRHFTNFIKKSWIFYTFQFFVALILSLMIIGNVENKIQEKTLATVKNEQIPIITYIENYKTQYGNVPKNITKAQIKPHTIRNISYSYGSNIFILETYVPSIDIDGAKIFYDSRDQQWYTFHNDEYQYYQDKKEKPKSIRTYMSLLKQIKTTKTLIIKNGQWVNTKQEIKNKSEKYNYINSSKFGKQE